ncbi:MAG: DUF4838 domain-containing protein, partial [Planctomycetes bacterium]|nr:DUF4838 domain-containing protein [Planctomycetota bacterium]
MRILDTPFARIQSLPTGRAAAFPKSGDFGYDSEPRYRNKNRLGLGEFVLATSAILALAWPCAAKPFVVVDENGRPACQVAQPPEATPAEKTALKMLIEYVGKSTGARLESVERDASKATKPVISLEVSPAWERLKNRRGHGPDGFTVEVQADRVRIIGDNPSSVIYGVASLLERGLGIRWLAPGELWTVVPKRRHVAIPPGTYRETPAFAKRVIHITGVHEHDGVKYPHWHFGSADWAMRNRLNRKFEHVGRTQLRDVMAERGLTPLRGGHAMAFWMPNEPFFAAHPEYYRFDGERRKPLRGGGTQLNYSSVETSALIAQRVLDFLERDPVAETVGVDLNDGYGFSLDRQSRQEWFYDERGMPIVSDSVFGFTNRVAEIVSRRFPDVAIGQLAYTRYYHQPPRFPLHPNVGIRFTLYRGSQTHPMCEARNESDAQMRRELQEWRKLTDKLLIYEYLTGYWGQMMFASGVRMIADDIRWYRKMGFEGAMTEYEPGKPAREMLYVYARLL